MIKRRRRVAGMAIIGVLSLDDEWHHGLAIAGAAGLSSARGMMALYALEELGVVEARWLEGPYPRRRQYRLVRNDNE
jgi:hypothetical protein